MPKIVTSPLLGADTPLYNELVEAYRKELINHTGNAFVTLAQLCTYIGCSHNTARRYIGDAMRLGANRGAKYRAIDVARSLAAETVKQHREK